MVEELLLMGDGDLLCAEREVYLAFSLFSIASTISYLEGL